MIIKIKKHLFLIIVLSINIAQGELFAQSNSNEDIVTAPNSIYGELAGQGIFLSANYDRILFNTTPHNIALRAGLGFWVKLSFSNNSESGITLPINISYLYGYNHKFELGVGYTIAPDASSLKLGDGTMSSPGAMTSIIGYRYQALDGGFVFRTALGIFLADEGKIIGLFGISLGHAF